MKKPIFWILVLATVLRLINLNQSLWLDEGIQWWASTSFSLSHLVTEYVKGDFNPPLFHIIIYFWTKLFGTSEINLRFPSVIFGVATVYLVYKITEFLKLKGKFSVFNFSLSIPEAAAALTATGPLLVYYSQEARVYSLAAFTATGAIYFLLKLKGKKLRLRSTIYYLLFLVAMLYSHYLTWLLIPLFLLVQPALTVFALLTLIPWMPIFSAQLRQGLATAAVNPVWAQTVGELSLKNLALIPTKFLVGRIPIEFNTFWTVIFITLLSLVGYLLYKAFSPINFKNLRSHYPRSIILAWFFLPLFLGVLMATKIPLLSYFRFLFILPAFYILLNLGASKLRQKFQFIAVTVLLTVNLLSTTYYLLSSTNHRENWQAAVAYIHSFKEAPVIINPAVRSPFEYYDQGRSIQIYEENLEKVINLPSIWYIPYAQPIFDPEDTIRQTLQNLGFKEIDKKHFRGVTVIKLDNLNFRHFSLLLP